MNHVHQDAHQQGDPRPASAPLPGWALAVGGLLVGVLATLAVVTATKAPAKVAAPAPAFVAVPGGVAVKPEASPIKFETVVVSLGAPLPRPPVTARVATIESRTSPSFAPLDGRVAEVAVRLGDTVKQGDKLVLVRSGDLASMHRELRAARLSTQTKKALAERLKLLVETRAAPKNDLLVAESELEEARLTASTAAAKLRSLGVKQEGDIGYWVLATRSGTVVQLDVSVGKQVGPDKDHPIATVADLDHVLVVGDLPEREARALEAGSKVRIRPQGVAGDVVEGVVEMISDVLDPERQTVPIRIRVDNQRRLLRPHSFVEAEISSPHEQSTIVVPSEAVVSDGAVSVVFVETEPSVLRRRVVRTGHQTRDRIEIVSGVNGGEKVVVRGALLLLNALDVKD